MACDAVAAAREEAAALGRAHRAPPMPLEECQRGIVENALLAPFVGVYDREFYPELEAKAAVLLFTLAKSQACQDGNKRLAAVLVAAFLALNGRWIQTTSQALEDAIRGAEAASPPERDSTITRLTEWLRAATPPLDEEPA
jgi:death-on-curing protein